MSHIPVRGRIGVGIQFWDVRTGRDQLALNGIALNLRLIYLAAGPVCLRCRMPGARSCACQWRAYHDPSLRCGQVASERLNACLCRGASLGLIGRPALRRPDRRGGCRRESGHATRRHANRPCGEHPPREPGLLQGSLLGDIVRIRVRLNPVDGVCANR